MRTWLFHPLIFYPLVILVAAAAIGFSLMPQMLPRDPAPVAGFTEDGALVLAGDALGAPNDPPQQNVTVARDFWGRAQSLRIAVLPDQGAPQPSESGVRILLEPQAAALLEGRGVTAEITYRPLPVNAASALAVSLQGPGAAPWVTQPIPPGQSGSVRFNLPAAQGIIAIGLRAVSGETGPLSYGVEIVSIRLVARN